MEKSILQEFGLDTEIHHCYVDYTLSQALKLAKQLSEGRATTLPLAKEHMQLETRYARFSWRTGQVALELIEAAITGKPIKEIATP